MKYAAVSVKTNLIVWSGEAEDNLNAVRSLGEQHPESDFRVALYVISDSIERAIREKVVETPLQLTRSSECTFVGFFNVFKDEDLHKKYRRLEKLVFRFLDPGDLGHVVGEAFRDECRKALGIPPVLDEKHDRHG